MSLRTILLFAVLIPTEALADTPDFKLTDTELRPPGAAAELGVRGTLPATSEGRRPISWRDQGSARELRGLVCIEHVFVDDSSSQWTPPDRLSALGSAGEALIYIAERAKAFDVSIQWRETISFYSTTDEISVEAPEHQWTGAAVGPARGARRFAQADICPVQECDQRLAILHVMKPGRSYALPSAVSGDAGVERVVMFVRTLKIQDYGEEPSEEASGIIVPERPSAFVHELLHVFGAEDMYTPAARSRIAQQRYPDEVMLRGSRALEYLSISTYTAYFIGWSEEEAPALPFE